MGAIGVDLVGVVPDELDPWFLEAIEEAMRENAVLRENGAEHQATARDALMRKFLSRAAAWLNEEIGVEEAAEALGRCPETVRRAVRDGDLPDRREKPRGKHRTRRGDVRTLARQQKSKYDPTADALDIAQRRKGAA